MKAVELGQVHATIGLLSLVIVLSGCAGYFVTVTDSPSLPPGGQASPSPTQDIPSDLPILQVSATEYGFQVARTVPAGPIRLVLTNAGTKDHNALVVRLDEPATFDDLYAMLTGPGGAGMASISTMAGGLAYVTPGSWASVVLDLEPGIYALMCYVREDDGRSHLSKGQIASLEVTEPASTAALPAADSAIVQRDFSFEGTTTLSQGRHTIAITNDGTQPHEANIARLSDGVTIEDIRAAITDDVGLPGTPWTAVGGAAAIAPGATQVLDVDLPPGEYAFFCVWPDTTTRKPHLQLGMVAPLTVR